MPIPLYIIIVRLLCPFLILRFPLLGILIATTIDMYDFKFSSFSSAADYISYQYWDKFLDIYYLSFALIVALKFKDIFFTRIAIFLYGFRFLGLTLFFLTGIRKMLFFFPNVFENFFIFYFGYILFFKKPVDLKSGKNMIIVFSFLLIPKLIHEYFIHFLEKQPWEIYNAGKYLGYSGILEEYTNYFTWGGLFYILPFLLLYIYFRFLK